MLNATHTAIQNLVSSCSFAEKNYLAAAECMVNPSLKNELATFAKQRATFRNQLESYTATSGFSAKNATETSLAKTETVPETAKNWLQFSTSTKTNATILSACETTDENVLKTYETVLQLGEIPNNVKNLLRRQLEEIEAAQTAVSTLKGMVL